MKDSLFRKQTLKVFLVTLGAFFLGLITLGTVFASAGKNSDTNNDSDYLKIKGPYEKNTENGHDKDADDNDNDKPSPKPRPKPSLKPSHSLPNPVPNPVPNLHRSLHQALFPQIRPAQPAEVKTRLLI